MSPTTPDLPFVMLDELADGDASPRSKVVLFRRGEYKHPRFGTWNITGDVLAGLAASFTRRLPVDLDHGPERGGSSEAAGWIEALELVGDELHAEIEWTTLGGDAIRDKRYLALSPTWSTSASDEHGNDVGPRLIGAALTNRPFFSFTRLEEQRVLMTADGLAASGDVDGAAIAILDAVDQIGWTAALEKTAAGFSDPDGDGDEVAYAAKRSNLARSLHDDAAKLYEKWADGQMTDAEVLDVAERLQYTTSRED